MAKPNKSDLVPGLETLSSLIAGGVLALIPLDAPVYAIISIVLLGLMGHFAWILAGRLGGTQLRHRVTASGLSALVLGIVLVWGAWARFSNPSAAPAHPLSVDNSPCSINAPSGGTNSVECGDPPATTKLIGGPNKTTDQNGVNLWTLTFIVDAKSPPNNILIFARGKNITAMRVSPLDAGGMINESLGTYNDGMGWFEFFNSPTGRYKITVSNTGDDVPNIGAKLNTNNPGVR